MKAEREILDRFHDAGPQQALRERVTAFAHAQFPDAMRDAFEDWFGPGIAPRSGEEVRAAAERAFVLELDGWITADGEPVTILREFASAQPAGSPDRERAEDWERGACFGIWRVTDLTMHPVVVLQDLLTGRRHFVSASSQQWELMREGDVAVGNLIPFDGIRYTGAVMFRIAEDQVPSVIGILRTVAARRLAEIADGEPRTAALADEIRALGDRHPDEHELSTDAIVAQQWCLMITVATLVRTSRVSQPSPESRPSG